MEQGQIATEETTVHAPRSPLYKQKWFMANAAFVVVVVIVAVTAVVLITRGSGNDVIVASAPETGATGTAADAPDEEPVGAGEELATPEDAGETSSLQDIRLGETISSPDLEFTLKSVEFSRKVTPKNTSSAYSYYDAPSGSVYIYVNATVKNLMKQDVTADEVYSVTADYNDGYTYNGFAICDDRDGDFTYANVTSVAPLASLGVHQLVECPEEVESSTSPLVLTILIGDGEYRYAMR